MTLLWPLSLYCLITVSWPLIIYPHFYLAADARIHLLSE